MIEFDAAGVAEGPAERLRAVSLRLEPRTLHIVFGTAGAGKSALIALAHGGLRPSFGAVRHFGATLRGRSSRAALRRRLGMVERPVRLLEHLTLRENVAAPLVAAGGNSSARADDVEALLAWTGLSGQAGHPAAALSPAERQRAALARAVILDPEVILADDPAAGLARNDAESLLALFADLARMGRTILIAIGDPEQADWLADRAPARGFTLDAGRLEAA